MVRRTWLLITVCMLTLLAIGACGDVKPARDAAPLAVSTAAPVPPTGVTIPPTTAPPTTPAAAPTAVSAQVAPPTATPTEPSVLVTMPAPAPATPTPTAPTPQPTPTAEPEPTALPVEATPTPEPEEAAAVNGATPHVDEVSLTQNDEVLPTVEVVKILRPSVVHIATQSQAMGQLNQPGYLQGVGTGIVLDLEGHILTNNHVIAGAARIIVTLSTDASYPAVVVGGDDRTGTAVIQIEAEGLQPAMLGIAAELEVGEDVIAIGHALGLRWGPTVSKGVVSALGRSLDTGAQTTIVDLIQTDASINPGNSGGPLVNSRAQVVGINTAIIVESQGIGFAINIDDAKVVAAQLIEKGFLDRGFLGITPFNLTPAVISQQDLRLPEDVLEGIIVIRAVPSFPAAEAGLQEGDVIVQLGDEPIANTGEMSKFLLNHPPGETISVSYFRGLNRITVELTLGENPLK